MRPGWWQGRMTAFDLETTAPDPEHARIVTAAIVHVGGGIEPIRWTLLADPGVEIPAGATAVHGITTEHARDHGAPLAEVIGHVTDRLTAYEEMPLVVYNAPYDLTVLDRECRRHGLEPFRPRHVIDPLVLDKHLDRYRRGSRKLEAVCAHHGATLARGHVIRQSRGPRERDELAALEAEWSRVHDDLDALVDAQRRWAAEQADGLADYFRRQGNHEAADGVRREWPIAAWGDVVGEAA